MTTHFCTSCGKSWECPQGDECVMMVGDVMLCSRCLNKSKKHYSVTDFGGSQ